MSSKGYTQEFKVEAVKQVTDRGHASGGNRSDVRTATGEVGVATGNRRARHSKKGRSVRCQAARVKYAFMLDHEQQSRLRSMCKVFGLHPSGYHAWLSAPMSPRTQDTRVLGLIKQSWLESGDV